MGDPTMSQGDEVVCGPLARGALLSRDCVSPWAVVRSRDQHRKFRLKHFRERSITSAGIDDDEGIHTLAVRELKVGLLVAKVAKDFHHQPISACSADFVQTTDHRGDIDGQQISAWKNEPYALAATSD